MLLIKISCVQIHLKKDQLSLFYHDDKQVDGIQAVMDGSDYGKSL